jgi:hypothetical protein
MSELNSFPKASPAGAGPYVSANGAKSMLLRVM